MWTSKQTGRCARTQETADLGVVTVSGQEAGVYLSGERRWLSVLAPGGYCWRPGTGDSVLVMKAGADGEMPCIVACQQEQPEDLQPGEVELFSRGCSIRLSNAGDICLEGQVRVNGEKLEDMIQAAGAGVE